ncbi:hypothetical protein SCHPADRAFT_944306 [Schizopora paradoxa]|uniref:Uncharacterized protein n=1 Tax=Schizopora paradoxa TaxID=27342 RepID=A0A0H2RUZ6_9AGAM|nr:hypothetical protein SCHPADRAFT_944306 [Schizopora paradoxa]
MLANSIQSFEWEAGASTQTTDDSDQRTIEPTVTARQPLPHFISTIHPHTNADDQDLKSENGVPEESIEGLAPNRVRKRIVEKEDCRQLRSDLSETLPAYRRFSRPRSCFKIRDSAAQFCELFARYSLTSNIKISIWLRKDDPHKSRIQDHSPITIYVLETADDPLKNDAVGYRLLRKTLRLHQLAVRVLESRSNHCLLSSTPACSSEDGDGIPSLVARFKTRPSSSNLVLAHSRHSPSSYLPCLLDDMLISYRFCFRICLTLERRAVNLRSHHPEQDGRDADNYVISSFCLPGPLDLVIWDEKWASRL